MTTDDEMSRFKAFCKNEAGAIRHEAAALGQPAEYVFLRSYPFILKRYRELVPTWSDFNMHSVEDSCYDDAEPLDLSEINRIRMDRDHPPLDFVPEVVGRLRFDPPKPRTPPVVDDQEQAFYKWAEERIITAHHAAAARNSSADKELFACPWMDVASIQRNFPGLNPAWCLQHMWFALSWIRPVLDPNRVKALKSWTDTVSEVGSEIAKLASGESAPEEFKQ